MGLLRAFLTDEAARCREAGTPALTSRNGQTISMSIMSLQVVSIDGSPASRGQLLIRALLFVIDIGMTPLIGLISMLVSTKNQRIGDHVAKTVVRSI